MILSLDDVTLQQIDTLYKDMEQVYDAVASELGLSCNGCPDNCCDSYFLHFTYIEWAYLWVGMRQLSGEKQEEIIRRAESYDNRCEDALARDERPRIMCPLNESGRCILYNHRLMVCRTHGVPAAMTRPDGKQLSFPGCFRCQDIVDGRGSDNRAAVMERTPLLSRLVLLEQGFVGGKRHLVPKVRMTIARMIRSGPPAIPHCSDR